MTAPVVKVEIAFTTQPNDPSPVWVDVTSSTKVLDGISITHGRQDQYSQVQPASLSLTLLNGDGRFTPGNTSSPYYPNVKKGRKIRVSVTDNGVTYIRFVGYVDEWPVEWADASATVANVRLSATSRMARLGKSRTLPTVIANEVLADAPLAYYPLNDGVGSLNAGNISTTIQPAAAVTPFGTGTNANVAFGASGAGLETSTAAAFTRISGSSGAYLSATVNGIDISMTPPVVLEAWVVVNTAQVMGIIKFDDAPNNESTGLYVFLGTDATGKLTAASSVAPTSTPLTSAASIADSKFHHVAVRQTTGGGGTLTLFLDGASVGSTAAPTAAYTLRRLAVGGTAFTAAFAGAIAHAALFVAPVSDARIQQHYLAGATGFSGERSDQRITRLAGYAGIPSGDVTVETGLSTSIADQDMADQIPIQLMQDVTATEGGVLFDATDGRFVFQSRGHRYNQASSLTLNKTDLLPTLAPKLDDQGLVNDISASRPNGVAVRTVDSNSINEYGVYRQDLTLLTTIDSEVFDAATWKIGIGSTPQVTVPVAEVELAAASTALKAAVLGREISDRVTLSSLPSQAPAPSMDFVIEGWTENITAGSHRVAFNLSNANLAGVWQLDSSLYSILDTSTRLAY